MNFIKKLFKKEEKSSCCTDLDTLISKAKKEEKKSNEKKCSCSFNLDNEIRKAKNK